MGKQSAELNSTGYNKTYTSAHTQAAMLLAGIGTGGFSVGSRGQLKDWEIFNHPDRGNDFPYTFFSIFAQNADFKCTRVLESRMTPPFESANGLEAQTVSGLPRFAESQMSVRFPFVNIQLSDNKLPFDVKMESFNPFIPLNADDSGIPAAIVRYTVSNLGVKPLTVSIAGSLYNASGFDGVGAYGTYRNCSDTYNCFREEGSVRGIVFDSTGLPENSEKYGNLTLMTRDVSITCKPEWSMGQRIDGIHDFWDDFCEDGKLDLAPAYIGVDGLLDKHVEMKIGSLAICHEIAPNEKKTYEFAISWYFPNRIKAWPDVQNLGRDEQGGETIRNYYATLFGSAWDVGRYLLSNLERLEGDSRKFVDAVYNSTLPECVIDAATANLAVLKSTTCFRIENGHMFGFEGCLDKVGSCPGNCTHVWYYAQAMAYLFPELERSMRETDFLIETDEDGLMQFRAMRELNGESWGFIPAADGQMGTIARLYREWLICGDDEFLKKLWPKAVKSLEYGIREWDTDGDYVLDGMMHVDYDVEFYGINPLSNLCYLVALKAAAKMAEYLGDTEHAKRYAEVFQTASKRADEKMWNGEYFIQVLEDIDTYKYQHGTGCLADQLIGQFYAYFTGLDYIINPDHVRKAALNIYKYNFLEDFSFHHNMQRTYAINDDRGLLMTTWPFGGRPKYPFFYSEEVWSRTEYHVAATLIYEGFVDEGLSIVNAVRDRYDGKKRNPWNEFECGFHYSGIMSSWAVLIALCGYRSDMPHKKMVFSPKVNQDNFRCFWSNAKAWGTFSQWREGSQLLHKVETLYGDLGDVDIVIEQ